MCRKCEKDHKKSSKKTLHVRSDEKQIKSTRYKIANKKVSNKPH